MNHTLAVHRTPGTEACSEGSRGGEIDSVFICFVFLFWSNFSRTPITLLSLFDVTVQASGKKRPVNMSQSPTYEPVNLNQYQRVVAGFVVDRTCFSSRGRLTQLADERRMWYEQRERQRHWIFLLTLRQTCHTCSDQLVSREAKLQEEAWAVSKTSLWWILYIKNSYIIYLYIIYLYIYIIYPCEANRHWK